MKKWIILAISSLLLLIGTNSSAMAEETLNDIINRGVLKVGLEVGYAPFELRNKAGDIVGFDIDFMRAAAKAMGVKVEFVNTAWDGIIPALVTKKFDIIAGGMTVTQARNMKINFANPYIVIGQSILVRKGLSEIKSYKDLNNPKYKIVVKLGTTGEVAAKKFMPRATLISMEMAQEASLEVINGKADAFVYDLPYNAVMAGGKGKGKVVHLDKTFTYEPLGWAIRKGDPDFLNWLNNFLVQAKNDGTYDRIYNKWIASDDWKDQ